MTFDKAHYPDEAAHEADRMADERDDAQERADRFAEKGPLPLYEEFCSGVAHSPGECPKCDAAAAERHLVKVLSRPQED